MGLDKNPIEEHPEYPLTSAATAERIDRWAESFLGDPSLPVVDHRIQEFLHLVSQYAFLEEIVQGEIRYELPVLPQLTEAAGVDPEVQAEEAAEGALELLSIPEVPALELGDYLESIGVKVVTGSAVIRIPGSVAETGGKVVADTDSPIALFFFEGDAGPAFHVSGDPEDADTPFMLAHLLGHLLADFDPYRNRVCRWHSGDLTNFDDSPEEVRADRFARALLLPGSKVREMLQEIGSAVQRGDGEAKHSWDVLETYFSTSTAILHRRLADLELEELAREMMKASERAPSPRASGETAGSKAESQNAIGDDVLLNETGFEEMGTLEDPGGFRLSTGLFTLPDRFVNLVLACYHERIMEIDVVAKFLALKEERARWVVEWSGVGRREETTDDEPVPPD